MLHIPHISEFQIFDTFGNLPEGEYFIDPSADFSIKLKIDSRSNEAGFGVYIHANLKKNIMHTYTNLLYNNHRVLVASKNR